MEHLKASISRELILRDGFTLNAGNFSFPLASGKVYEISKVGLDDFEISLEGIGIGNLNQSDLKALIDEGVISI
jgi:hypothetical protein